VAESGPAALGRFPAKRTLILVLPHNPGGALRLVLLTECSNTSSRRSWLGVGFPKRRGCQQV